METGFMNRITGLVIALVVGGLLVGGLLIPSIEGMTATETTFENEGYYTMDALDATTESTITWEKSNIDILNVNGTDIDMSNFVGSGHTSFTLIGGESIVLRYEKTSSTFAGIQGYGVGGRYISFHSNSVDTVGDKLTITVSNGAVNVATNGESPINYDFNDVAGFIINPAGTGNYAVMKRADIPANVLGDSSVYLIGVSVAAGPNAIALYGVGSVDDGVDISTVYKPNSITTVSYSEPVATYTEVAGYDDLYKLDKYQFTITYDTSTYDATYSYFIVPAEVTAEKTHQMDATQIAMFGVISILGIVALVVVAANGIRNKY